ncbi:hypothetical protein K8R33_03330 [archaeon]|nr:hypothetical protein [archaeon]
MRLTDKLRELTGRKLTQIEMELAEKGPTTTTEHSPIGLFFNTDRRLVKEYKKGFFHTKPTSGSPVAYAAYVVDSHESGGATPDFSYWWERPHWGWNSDKRVKRVYNTVDGLLVEEEIIEWNSLDGSKTNVKRYEPRGRFFGKLVKANS